MGRVEGTATSANEAVGAGAGVGVVVADAGGTMFGTGEAAGASPGAGAAEALCNDGDTGAMLLDVVEDGAATGEATLSSDGASAWLAVELIADASKAMLCTSADPTGW